MACVRQRLSLSAAASVIAAAELRVRCSCDAPRAGSSDLARGDFVALGYGRPIVGPALRSLLLTGVGPGESVGACGVRGVALGVQFSILRDAKPAHPVLAAGASVPFERSPIGHQRRLGQTHSLPATRIHTHKGNRLVGEPVADASAQAGGWWPHRRHGAGAYVAGDGAESARISSDAAGPVTAVDFWLERNQNRKPRPVPGKHPPSRIRDRARPF